MALQQVLEIYELLDSAVVTGKMVADLLQARGANQVEVTTIEGQKGTTDFLKIIIPGTRGKQGGGSSRTLGILGRLGGIGARPEHIGLVSDGDGAVTALAAALKLLDMQRKGDSLPGDVIIGTHICPDAPVIPHKPVDFMDSPVDMQAMNCHEVDPQMDAILSIDTTKGNRILNVKGFAISASVKEGYILRISEDLVRIMEITSGKPAVILPITMQDITPYGNDVFHINSIMQPSVATDVPVVGVAMTTATIVPGCASGASHVIDIEVAVRFCIEVAKEFGAGLCQFYDEGEFQRLVQLYGSMKHLQTLPSNEQ
ncbi:hypothetical protein U27_05011 [Candidatus Vecturithrix granuli]|uniref:DUF1177 domain-containing protein n=1 Tax=Vecturithrix granuli TaxID=1499967 RepID=A0A081C0D3_VECG1|nr:hypothetical protein U27_05011 [Candidatus Vecturithrix granuli]